MSFFSKFLQTGKSLLDSVTIKERCKLVVALNCIDMIEPYDWDREFNLPSDAQERNIEKRKKEVAKMLREIGVKIPEDQIVAYSALQCFELSSLMKALIYATEDAFILDKFNPKSFISKTSEKIQADPLIREKLAERDEKMKNVRQLIEEHMRKELSDSDYKKLVDRRNERLAIPPQIMLLGQTGVGKTTTVAGLLGIDQDAMTISHVDIATKDIEKHSISYNGGTIDLYDLPGYGTLEDKDYELLYRQILPKCDVVLFVLKITNGMVKPDQEMILNVYRWLNESK